MAQDTRKICANCKHYLGPDRNSVWAQPPGPVMKALTKLGPPHPAEEMVRSKWDVGNRPGCAMSIDIITGQHNPTTAWFMRHEGDCGIGGRLYEPATTMQGEP